MTALFTKFRQFTFNRLFRCFIFLALFFSILCVLVDQGVAYYVRKSIYTDIKTLPYRPYALVLGTSKYIAKGKLNGYYVNRLEAAKTLYEMKKASFFLLSGDNRTMEYNEPRTMFRDLRKMGLPETILFQDFAGFRTLDSVIRAEQVFHANSMTIISQKFHCERAVLIAKYHNIDAICFVAEQPNISSLTRIREVFARVRAVLDLMMGTEPYFLGNPEPLPAINPTQPPQQISVENQSV